jgi:hypothetical protein
MRTRCELGRRRHQTGEPCVVEVPPVPDDELRALADCWRSLDSTDDVASAVLAAAVRLLPIDGAAVLLMSDQTRWTTAAATDTTVTELIDLEQTLGDGPSVEAYLSAGPVLVPDLPAAVARWPLLPPAVRLICAYFSLPLQIGAVRMGVLDLYRRSPGRLDGEDLGRALRLADLAAGALVRHDLNAVTGPTPRPPAETSYRPEIDQATGMLSVFLNVDILTAYARLRAHAFAVGLPLAEVAAAIVLGTIHLDGEAARPDGPDR